MLQQQFYASVFQRCLPAWVSKKDALADLLIHLQAKRTTWKFYALHGLTSCDFLFPKVSSWAPISNAVKVREESLMCSKRKSWIKTVATQGNSLKSQTGFQPWVTHFRHLTQVCTETNLPWTTGQKKKDLATPKQTFSNLIKNWDKSWYSKAIWARP